MLPLMSFNKSRSDYIQTVWITMGIVNQTLVWQTNYTCSYDFCVFVISNL